MLSFKEAAEIAEQVLGVTVPDGVVNAVLEYTERKLEVIKQSQELPDGYIKILFATEIKDHYMRALISNLSMAR